MIKSKLFLLSLGVLALSRCSSAPPRGEIAATASPQEEISRLNSDLNSAIANHADVLAPEDFKAAQGWLKEATEDVGANQKQEETLDDLRKGRGYLNRANEITQQRSARIQGVLDSRGAAVTAGARNFPRLSDQLKKYDDSLRVESSELGNMSPTLFGKMQGQYMDLALDATQETQLGTARAEITGSKDAKARKLAPQSLKRAEMDLANAENVIAANRNEPGSYASAVEQSQKSARFLRNVIATMQGNKKLDEASASNVVRKNMEIAALKSDLKDAGTEMATRNRQLANAEKTISVQEALENARKEFDESEAEVFQQGDKLVVRLKSMAFASGRADLPGESLNLLAKVKDVAQSLNPSAVMVEGHTDSTGSEEKNMSLSEDRARIVANYLEKNGLSEAKIESVGLGFKKPVATNKSKAGRAQNRRVDVIITPASGESSRM